MNTNDLISALAADARAREAPIGRALALALGAGALVSLALFLTLIGPRPDVMNAVHTVRFDLKFVDTLAWLTPSLLLALRLARPEASPGALVAWLFAPLALLIVGVGVELSVTPRAVWMTRLVGTNWYHCLSIIPLLSIPPLGALIAALRNGAPSYPALTGALAGAAAAGAAATMYARYCPDDSPRVVVTWSPLATLVVVSVGALAGRRWLQW